MRCFLALTCLVVLGCPSSDDGADTGGGGSSDGSTTAAPMTTAMTTTMTTAPSDTTSSDDPSDSTGNADASTGATGEDTGSDSSSGGPPVCPRQTHQCAQIVANWEGPVAARSGAAGDDTLVCSGNYPDAIYDGQTDPVIGSHDCVCACNPPGNASGITCNPAELEVWNNPICAGAPIITVDIGTGCPDVPNFAGSDRVRLNDSTFASAPACSTSTAGTFTDPVVFDGAVVACSGEPFPAEDCAADEACMASPTPPLESGLCIYRDGDHLCPEGSPYLDRRVAVSAVVDNRSCAACTCGALTGTCSPNTAVFHPDASCDIMPVGSQSDDNCDAASPIGGSLISSVQGGGSTVNPGYSCQPGATSNNDDIGEVTYEGEITVCCIP